MKKYLSIFAACCFFASCKEETAIEKPENLIPEEKMADIIYDLSILQAMRNSHQAVLDSSHIDPNTYVYKKYKIDSLQFARSNAYYAAKSIKDYEKIYTAVNDRILAEKASADSASKKK
ncbi:MAG TPA: DUF4296 domain-containing protein [Flavobacterium sp.]|nr:DUF4296 domain-containing protein [Flavobacterium sp.]